MTGFSTDLFHRGWQGGIVQSEEPLAVPFTLQLFSHFSAGEDLRRKKEVAERSCGWDSLKGCPGSHRVVFVLCLLDNVFQAKLLGCLC